MPLPLFLLPLLLPVAPLVDGGFETLPLAPTTSTERGVWSVFIHGESDAGFALVDGAGREGSRAVRYHKTAEGNQNIHLDQIVEARGLAIVSDDGALIAAIDEALAQQPDVLEKIRDGKVQAAGAVIGAVMKAMRGQADAARVRELVLERAAQ